MMRAEPGVTNDNFFRKSGHNVSGRDPSAPCSSAIVGKLNFTSGMILSENFLKH